MNSRIGSPPNGSWTRASSRCTSRSERPPGGRPNTSSRKSFRRSMSGRRLEGAFFSRRCPSPWSAVVRFLWVVVSGSWSGLARRGAQGVEGGNELVLIGARLVHRELHTPYTDRDERADLQQPQPDRVRTGASEHSPRQLDATQRVHQHVGGRGEP